MQDWRLIARTWESVCIICIALSSSRTKIEIWLGQGKKFICLVFFFRFFRDRQVEKMFSIMKQLDIDVCIRTCGLKNIKVVVQQIILFSQFFQWKDLHGRVGQSNVSKKIWVYQKPFTDLLWDFFSWNVKSYTLLV